MPVASMVTNLTSNNVNITLGHLPLILTVPHGGSYFPKNIPNRTQGMVKRDVNTIRTAQAIFNHIKSHYNATPYMITLLVGRRKVDVNRPIELGTESSEGEIVWKEYHTALKNTINMVKNIFGEALLLDIHGQSHAEGMVELGYLLTRIDLYQDILSKESILERSSIRRLANRVASSITLNTDVTIQSLIRGKNSFGSMMMILHDDIKVIPSEKYLSPSKTALYYTGGYTTKTYSSEIDVIQIECPYHLRNSEEGIQKLAASIANAAVIFLDQYYIHKSKPIFSKQFKL